MLQMLELHFCGILLRIVSNARREKGTGRMVFSSDRNDTGL